MVEGSLTRLWVRVLFAFAGAVGMQIAMYAPVWRGASILKIPSRWAGLWLSMSLTTFFFIGPGIIAALVARRMVRRAQTAGTPSPIPMSFIVLLALVSFFLGPFICFNKWGT